LFARPTKSRPCQSASRVDAANKKGEEVARTHKEYWPTSLAKVRKKAVSISHLMTEEDQAESLRVLRDAKHATHRIFDPAAKQLIEVPDQKNDLLQ
jgi:hypothetical protein